MALTLLIGGARSGKSALAVRRARAHGGPVSFVATAQAGDGEMTERIALHRAEREPGWATLEEPIELGGALAGTPPGAFVIVDCLSLWIANLLVRGDDDAAIERLTAEAAALAAERGAPTIAVSNEVGMGVVPASESGRRYRDLLGRANATWAALADEALLVIAGRTLTLEALDGL
jgi:adenosylcobinamide kinase/adenosylcobinamide-phosphate guanylyltransferase